MPIILPFSKIFILRLLLKGQTSIFQHCLRHNLTTAFIQGDYQEYKRTAEPNFKPRRYPIFSPSLGYRIRIKINFFIRQVTYPAY